MNHAAEQCSEHYALLPNAQLPFLSTDNRNTALEGSDALMTIWCTGDLPLASG